MAYNLKYAGYSTTDPTTGEADELYRLKYSDYPGTAEGPPDPDRWIGPPGPQGPVGPMGPPGPVGGGYVLPVASTTVLGGVRISGTSIKIDAGGTISADAVAALGYTPYNATNPSGYQTAAQVAAALTPYAPLAGPVFTGDARAVTPNPGDNDTSIATTAFVQAAVGSASGGASIGVSPPALPNPGAFWWDSNAGVLYVRYDDGTSAQWVPATPAAAVRSNARLQAQWVSGAVVANDTVYMAFDVPYAGTINSLTYFTANGSFSVNIQINGASVGGLSAIAVSSATPATANATAANTFAAGQRITAVVTAATGSPTDALLSLAVTWS